LAKKTGGQYRHARDIDKLKLILDEISQELQEKEYVFTFPDWRGNTGDYHRIEVELVHKNQVVQKTQGEVVVRGVVIAEMNPFIYLGLLGCLGLLLAIPAFLGRVLRSLTS